MEIRKNTLWRVPVFCLIAGEFAYHIVLRLLIRWALVPLPDGTLTIDSGKEMLIYGLILIATLLIGRWFFRTMNRKEIFVSASILILFDLTLTGIQFLLPPTKGAYALFFLYASRLFEWSNLIYQLIFQITGSIWAGVFLNCLAPYLFVLPGRRK